MNICSLSYINIILVKTGERKSRREGGNIPASQRQKLEPLSEFRAGPLTLFQFSREMGSQIGFLLSLECSPSWASTCLVRARGEGAAEWLSQRHLPTQDSPGAGPAHGCPVSDLALCPASQVAWTFNHSELFCFCVLAGAGVGRERARISLT